MPTIPPGTSLPEEIELARLKAAFPGWFIVRSAFSGWRAEHKAGVQIRYVAADNLRDLGMRLEIIEESGAE
ncbi:MAG TPA: hypothetical protein VEJ42_06520 [Streptosporangiaceae bacterium]|nr:hypothetical protein [Streptosporangiaceae bacterium]